MDMKQKERISALRSRGEGYASIAKILGLTKSQVSGYCRRAGLSKGDMRFSSDVCPECGSPIEQSPGRKPRRFCSDRCRMAWWNSHPEMVRRRANYTFECAGCGNAFTAYGNAHRKYCSHACYIADRYGRGGADGQA